MWPKILAGTAMVVDTETELLLGSRSISELDTELVEVNVPPLSPAVTNTTIAAISPLSSDESEVVTVLPLTTTDPDDGATEAETIVYSDEITVVETTSFAKSLPRLMIEIVNVSESLDRRDPCSPTSMWTDRHPVAVADRS